MAMFPKLKHDVIALIHGYIKIYNELFTPNEIIQIIILFYGYGFDIYDQNGNDIIKNCDIFYINSEAYFYAQNNNTIYVSGSNRFGQIGLNMDIRKVKKPIKFKLFKYDEISLISQGMANDHVFIYTKDNKLYGFGKNGYKQLGTLLKKSNTATLIDHPFKSKLKKISCGWKHSLFLTIKGNVYGCGDNIHAQLIVNTPIINSVFESLHLIQSNGNITNIDCCENSSYLLTNNNILNAFGSNSNGEIGKNSSGKTHFVFSQAIVSTFNCGYSHVGVLTLDNKVYMFGCNAHFECGYVGRNPGNGNLIKLSKPIISVKCGDWHTIVKTINNNYYSFGNNKFYQLLLKYDTHNFIKNQSKPQLISLQYVKKLTQSNNKIIDIIPVYEKTLVIQAV